MIKHWFKINSVIFMFAGLGLWLQPLFGATITFKEDSTSNFNNPERGPRDGSETITRYYIGLDRSRTQDNLDAGEVKAFRDQCNWARNNGQKLIVRPRYSKMRCGSECDAPLSRVLKHIDQLGVIIQENADVIAVVEVGWIGPWGEWHYWNANDVNQLLKTENARQIVFRMLSVVPKDRMVALRYNWHKREIFGTDESLGPDSAFSGSYRARTGAHNDCVGFNADDRGTYQDPLGLNPDFIEDQKTYLSNDNRYVPQIGETCRVQSGFTHTCESIKKEFKRMHWDILESGSIESYWGGEQCKNYIYSHWGYRLVMRKAELPYEINPGGTFTGVINLINTGWGKIYNPRGIELVFQNTQTNDKAVVKLGNDPRRWCMTDDERAVTISAKLPADIPEGSYKVYLNLPDTASRLYGRPEYSIRLANVGVWENSTGYNSLQHTVNVTKDFIPLRVSNVSDAVKSLSVSNRNGSTEIRYSIEKPMQINIEIFDLSGNRVWHNVQPAGSAGLQKAVWNGGAMGLYVLKLSASGEMGLPNGKHSFSHAFFNM